MNSTGCTNTEQCGEREVCTSDTLIPCPHEKCCESIRCSTYLPRHLGGKLVSTGYPRDEEMMFKCEKGKIIKQKTYTTQPPKSQMDLKCSKDTDDNVLGVWTTLEGVPISHFPCVEGCNYDDKASAANKCQYCDDATWKLQNMSCPKSLPGGSIENAYENRLVVGSSNLFSCEDVKSYIEPKQYPPVSRKLLVHCNCHGGYPTWVAKHKDDNRLYEVKGCSKGDQCTTDDDCRYTFNYTSME